MMSKFSTRLTDLRRMHRGNRWPHSEHGRPSRRGDVHAAGFCRDGHELTAAKIGGNVTGFFNAAGCDIGVDYGPGTTGSVNKATITNAKYFGVVNYDGNVDVKNSTISRIGELPFNGTQHGVGILYTTEETPGGETSGTTRA